MISVANNHKIILNSLEIWIKGCIFALDMDIGKKAGKMEESVALQQRIEKEEKEFQKLEKKMRNERQINIQMELHKRVIESRKALQQMKEELEKLK